MFYVPAFVSALMTFVKEQEVFEEQIKSMPQEEADKLRKIREDRLEKEREHRKKLEIAEAGRPRNFWGK